MSNDSKVKPPRATTDAPHPSPRTMGVVSFAEWPGKPGCMFIRVYLQPNCEGMRKRIIRDTKKLVRDLGFVALDGEPQGDV